MPDSFDQKLEAIDYLRWHFSSWATLSSKDIKESLKDCDDMLLFYMADELESLRNKIRSTLYEKNKIEYEGYVPQVDDIVGSKLNPHQQYEVIAIRPEVRIQPLPKIGETYHTCADISVLTLIHRPNQKKPIKPFSRKVQFKNAEKV